MNSRKKALFFLLFISSKWIYGQTNFISVLSPQPINAIPGNIVTISLKLINNSDSGVTLIPDFSFPEKLNCIMCNQLINMKAKEERFMIVPFYVPKNTVPGIIKFTYRLKDTSSSIVFGETGVQIVIESKVDFSAILINAPKYVRGGEDINADVIIRNNGNAPLRLKLVPHGIQNIDQNYLELGIGEKKQIALLAHSDKNQVKSDFQTIGIKLISLEDSSNIKDLFFSVYVLPFREQKKSKYFSIPAEIKFNYFTGNNERAARTGYQIEAFLKGYIDKSYKHKVEILARGPNRFSSSSLGLYDEYYARYENAKLNVHVGDKVYSLTPLTEISRFARGAEVQRFYGKTMFGSFYNQPRFFNNIKSEYAFYGTHEFKNKITVGLYHLTKQNRTDSYNARIASATVAYRLKERFFIETELSQSIKNNVLGMGFRTVSSYYKNKLSANFTVLKTSRNYQGYYQNTSFLSFISTYKINAKTDVNLNITRDYKSPLLDTFYQAAPLSKNYSIGLGRKFKYNLGARLVARYFGVKDRAENKKFDYETSQIQLLVNQKLKKIGYYFIVDYGITKNFMVQGADATHNSRNIYTELQYFPNNKFYFSIFQNSLTSNRYSINNQNTIYFGSNLSWTQSNNFQISLQYQSNYLLEDYYRNRDALQLLIKYGAEKRIAFDLTTRYVYLARQINAKEFYVFASLKYRFGFPISKIASYGKISGVINNRTGNSSKGIVIQLDGRSQISRKDGVFSFSNVTPGSYFIIVDQESLGLNEVTDNTGPIKVEVVQNKETFVNINIITSAQVSGKINLIKQQDILDDDSTAIVPTIVLELKNEFETRTIYSEPDGSFQFKRLRPGKYTLKAFTNMLENKYVLDQELFNFELESGENLKVSLVMRKKKKKIHFLQGTDPKK